MIDNLPYYTTDATSIINAYSNKSLIFVKNEERANRQSGELYYVHIRRYLNLRFTFLLDNNGSFVKLTIRGSIHKLFNQGLHNANNFNFKDFKSTLRAFFNDFGIDMFKCVLLPFEYGVNLSLDKFSDYNAHEIVLNTICEQRKIFIENVGGCTSSKISGSIKNETRTKVYDKSIESNNYCENTLRIEIQQKKIRGLNKRDLYYVSDLLILKNQIYLCEKYMKYVSQLVIFDYTIQVPKGSKYYPKSRELKDPNYWRKLIIACKKGEVYNTKYNDSIVLLNFLSKKYGTNLKKVLIEQLEKQYLSNLFICNLIPYKLLKTPKDARLTTPKDAQLYNRCFTCEVSYGFKLDNKRNKFIPIKKHCLVTGLDISMQKEESFLLSHTGIRYYYVTNRNVFDKVKSKFLSNKWQQSNFNVQIKEIAHNIRDTIRNQRRKQQKVYPSHQPQLFDLRELEAKTNINFYQ